MSQTVKSLVAFVRDLDNWNLSPERIEIVVAPYKLIALLERLDIDLRRADGSPLTGPFDPTSVGSVSLFIGRRTCVVLREAASKG